MSVFEILIAPFLFLIKQIFTFAFSVAGNYGQAIVLLSLIISLLLLPVFILIEKAKKKDDAIKRKMKPFVDEIKRCYKGQERFYYLKTLNRQFAYSPVHALVPVLSLLIQIPFFIAAYQFLEAFEPLKEVSFLFVKDLSEPDGVFGVVNILPILMTVVNLLTAYFYTKHGDGAERNQMLVVAAIFLVLLFNLPSGLVLYWTMNNVFSFLRLFITNPEVFRKEDRRSKSSPLKINFRANVEKQKYVFGGIVAFGLYSQIKWVFENNFNDIFLRLLGAIAASVVLTFIVGFFKEAIIRNKKKLLQIEVSPQIYFSLLLIVAYFYISGVFYFEEENKDLLRISAFLVVPLQLISLLYLYRGYLAQKIRFVYLVSFSLVFLFVVQALNLSASSSSNANVSLSFLNIDLSISQWGIPSFIKSGLLISLLSIPIYIKLEGIRRIHLSKSYLGIAFLALAYLSGLVFLWNPIIVYTSYPSFFDFPVQDIVKNNLSLFVLATLCGMILYFIISKKWRFIFLYIAIVTVCIFFVNSFIVPIDLGALHVSKFSSQENLAAPIHHYFLELIFILGVLFAVSWLFKKKAFKQIAVALIVLNLVLVGQAGMLVFSENRGVEHNDAVVVDGEISFSKDQENVVLVIFDGFQGWFMDKVFKEDSTAKELFDGFTWYPNTVSISSLTFSSTAGIMCGLDYSVDKLNADKEHTIREKVNIPCNLFIDRVKSEGYHMSSTKMWHSTIDKSQYDNLIPDWHKLWGQKLKYGEQWELWFTRLWETALFYGAPLSFKPKIYNDQDWLVQHDVNSVTSETHKYHFLNLLPQISNANSKSPNFIYIHNMASHSPWNVLDGDNKLQYKVSPYENNKWCIYQMVDWINWMKENEVYDNTKIIILSDHGPTWEEYKPGFTVESPLKIDENDPDKIIIDRFWRLNALLMVKDFNKSGAAIEDWRLMSNADAASIIFDEENPTNKLEENRIVPTSWAYWKKGITLEYEYDMYKFFEVEGNMYDLSNWKEVKY